MTAPEIRTPGKLLHIPGVPNEKQQLFFDSRARFTAYGGARGGGKSWALRRKLVGLCLRYPGITCLLVRRSLPELKANHLRPFLSEYAGLLSYSEDARCISCRGGGKIYLGYCACDRDALRYQGQEYDVIAIDEATQLTEHQFQVLKACLRGTGVFPRRMYLTCNPGGVGHAWVKRLFIDRLYRTGEEGADYRFVPARVWDNPVLCGSDPDYVRSLKSLPPRLRDAWLEGRWDVFEGQFFPEFNPDLHVVAPCVIPTLFKRFLAIDYGFDMLAVLAVGVGEDGRLFVTDEYLESGLTLGKAAEACVAFLCKTGFRADYAVASPDLWNRRQDSGKSGFEIMQSVPGMPPMVPADNRRVAGWRVLREALRPRENDSPGLLLSSTCRETARCLSALQFDSLKEEDAADEPHAVTHAPEALRYAVMSRVPPAREPGARADFKFPARQGKSPF